MATMVFDDARLLDHPRVFTLGRGGGEVSGGERANSLPLHPEEPRSGVSKDDPECAGAPDDPSATWSLRALDDPSRRDPCGIAPQDEGGGDDRADAVAAIAQDGANDPDLPDIARAFALREAALRLTAIQLAPARPPISRGDSLDVEPVSRPRRAAPARVDKPKPRFRALWWTGLAASCALVGLIAGREAIAARAPQTARLYALAGLAARAPLRIDGVAAHVAEIDGRSFLVVEGDIGNRAGRRMAVPGLALAVVDGDGATLYRWEAATGLGDLEPGRTGRFRARLAAPPPNGHGIVVRFVDPAPG